MTLVTSKIIVVRKLSFKSTSGSLKNIYNELHHMTNNNSIRYNPTTGFVLIRTYQAGIVARNR